MESNDEKDSQGCTRWVIGLIGLVASLMGIWTFCGGPGLPLLQGIGSAASTTSPTLDTHVTSPKIIYQSTLTMPDGGWDDADLDQYCYFANDGFHVKPEKACRTPVHRSDVDVSVQMRQISGDPTDMSGIEVRRNSRDSASLYEFDINANGGWLFKLCILSFDNCPYYKEGTDSAIHTGMGVGNTIEVRAVGPQFTLLVNGKQVWHVDDSTLTVGDIWLETGGNSECVFTYFKAVQPV